MPPPGPQRGTGTGCIVGMLARHADALTIAAAAAAAAATDL